MPAASYRALVADTGPLVGVVLDVEIDAADLLKAELQAKTTIDTWLLGMCGAARGSEIVDEFEAADEDAIDPDIAELAELYGVSIVRRWVEAKNFGNVQSGDAPRTPTAGEKALEEAKAKAKAIFLAGKVRKAAGGYRRLRYGPREQGPSAGGPMAGGSFFDAQQQRRLPLAFDPARDFVVWL